MSGERRGARLLQVSGSSADGMGMATSVQALWSALLAAVVGIAMVLHGARGAARQEPEVDRGAGLGPDLLLRPFLVAVAAWTLMVLVASVVWRVTFFDVLSFLYLAVVLTGPLVGGALLAIHAAAKRGQPVGSLRTSTRVLAVLLLLAAPLGIWMSRVEPRRLEVDRHDVVLGDGFAGEDPVRIGVIADIQTIAIGDHEERAVRMLLEQDPDVVLIAGDLFQGSEPQYEVARDRFRGLLSDMADVPGGAFVVGGDVDHTGTIDALIDGTGVRALRSEVEDLVIGDRTVRILGLPLKPDPASDAALASFAAEPDDGAARIVLAHRPDWAQRFGDGPAGVDLVIAGHTHGGQVQLPLIGPLMTMTAVPRHMAAGGLHVLDGQRLYISTGVGMEQQGAPQIRLLARPSVGLLVLR